jgi:flavine halogenase
MLLRHASSCGASVFEQTKVSEIEFVNRNRDDLRPFKAHFMSHTGEKGSIAFDYLVDASGRNGIMSTKVCPLSFVKSTYFVFPTDNRALSSI